MKTRAKQAKKPSVKQASLKGPSKKRKPTAAAKKRAAGEDAGKPKKPPTAFFYFLENFRKTYQEENPDVKSMRDIGKACGEKWKTLSFEEKVPYYDVATEKRAEFDKAMAAYAKKKGSGELSEGSDDFE